MALEGVDYAWSRPDIGQLAAVGKMFACRYGGPGSLGKQLDPAEAVALSAAGVAIVANAEGAANGLLSGWPAGADWATRAEAHFAACGMPPGRPIYLSVDFDVSTMSWPAVADALRGAASVLGAARVGVYGGRRAIEWARRDGVAAWFWQTYAWSSGVWVPGNHIEQYHNGVSLAGATLDLDRALPADFGQWKVGAVDLETKLRNADGLDRSLGTMIKDIWDELYTLKYSREFPDRYPDGVGGRLAALLQRPAATLTDEDRRAIAALVAAELKASLAELRTGVRTDTRDAIADLGEKGAAGVRAEQ